MKTIELPEWFFVLVVCWLAILVVVAWFEAARSGLNLRSFRLQRVRYYGLRKYDAPKDYMGHSKAGRWLWLSMPELATVYWSWNVLAWMKAQFLGWASDRAVYREEVR